MVLCSLIMRNQHPAKWICREIPWSCSLPWSERRLSLVQEKAPGQQSEEHLPRLLSSLTECLKAMTWAAQSIQTHQGWSSRLGSNIWGFSDALVSVTISMDSKPSLPLKEPCRNCDPWSSQMPGKMYTSVMVLFITFFSTTAWNKMFLKHVCASQDQETGFSFCADTRYLTFFFLHTLIFLLWTMLDMDFSHTKQGMLS